MWEFNWRLNQHVSDTTEENPLIRKLSYQLIKAVFMAGQRVGHMFGDARLKLTCCVVVGWTHGNIFTGWGGEIQRNKLGTGPTSERAAADGPE